MRTHGSWIGILETFRNDQADTRPCHFPELISGLSLKNDAFIGSCHEGRTVRPELASGSARTSEAHGDPTSPGVASGRRQAEQDCGIVRGSVRMTRQPRTQSGSSAGEPEIRQRTKSWDF